MAGSPESMCVCITTAGSSSHCVCVFSIFLSFFVSPKTEMLLDSIGGKAIVYSRISSVSGKARFPFSRAQPSPFFFLIPLNTEKEKEGKNEVAGSRQRNRRGRRSWFVRISRGEVIVQLTT